MFTAISAMHGHLSSQFVHAASKLNNMKRPHGHNHDFSVPVGIDFYWLINEHDDDDIIWNVIFSYKSQF